MCQAGDLPTTLHKTRRTTLNILDTRLEDFFCFFPPSKSGLRDQVLARHRPDLAGAPPPEKPAPEKEAAPLPETGGSFWDRLRNRGQPLTFSRR